LKKISVFEIWRLAEVFSVLFVILKNGPGLVYATQCDGPLTQVDIIPFEVHQEKEKVYVDFSLYM
jgi:hypothetical protein